MIINSGVYLACDCLGLHLVASRVGDISCIIYELLQREWLSLGRHSEIVTKESRLDAVSIIPECNENDQEVVLIQSAVLIPRSTWYLNKYINIYQNTN